MSRRNAVLHLAASSNVRGGTKRVFVHPGNDALAITAIPQVGTRPLSMSATAVGMVPPRELDCNLPGSRSEEHTSELQSPDHLVCRLLLEKKKKIHTVIKSVRDYDGVAERITQFAMDPVSMI